jgi:glyoxylase-like metal-dependent hydrolase (beta-lactamase superfamily II)
MRKILRPTLLLLAALLLCECDIQHFLMTKALAQQVEYFQTPSSTGMALTKLADRVWTFNDAFDRSLVVDTDDGLVVVDPFREHLVTGLKNALEHEGIRKPVHTLIYTHYHVDHVRGGAALAPQHVIAHEKCPLYWKDFASSDILPPTQLVNGDLELNVGGVVVRLVYLGLSHTDTLYAVYLPAQGVLYAADTVGVRVFLPVGGIALYSPGYFRALERLSALPFTTFVGSHFGWGTKTDFLDAVQLQRDIRDQIRAAMLRHPGTHAAYMDTGRLTATFDEFYYALRPKYGDWHGFEAQIFPSFLNGYVNEVVGN